MLSLVRYRPRSLLFLFLVPLAALLGACRTAEADQDVVFLVRHGRFDEAVALAADVAAQNPEDQGVQELYRRALSAYLLEENLATIDEETGNSDNQSEYPEAEELKAYEQPRFEKYDDMAELFALDPPLPQLPDLPMKVPGG